MTDNLCRKFGDDFVYFSYGANCLFTSSPYTFDYYGIWWGSKTAPINDSTAILPRAMSEVKNPSVTMLFVDSRTHQAAPHSAKLGAEGGEGCAINPHNGKINYVAVGGNVVQGKYPEKANEYTSHDNTPDWWRIKEVD